MDIKDVFTVRSLKVLYFPVIYWLEKKTSNARDHYEIERVLLKAEKKLEAAIIFFIRCLLDKVRCQILKMVLKA